MSAPPGYYRDPHQPVVARRWDGTGWTKEARPADDDSLPLPGNLPLPPPLPTPTPDEPSRTLRIVGGLLVALAVLVAVAAVASGIVLMAHTTCADFCDSGGSRHPYLGAGFGVMFGGLVQAALLAGVGLLCQEVDTLRHGAPERPASLS